MPAEYRNPDGTWSQGYFCSNCGKSCNMHATGHGIGYCEPNPELVKELWRANSKNPVFEDKSKPEQSIKIVPFEW